MKYDPDSIRRNVLALAEPLRLDPTAAASHGIMVRLNLRSDFSHNRKDSDLVSSQDTLHRDARRTISLNLPHLEHFASAWAFEFTLNLYLRTEEPGAAAEGALV